ncbi:MAG TPA: glucokinase [Bryobacteraceae bacterium]|nr:glucokinase [Bryobacteraceae bacterium]
MILAADVGGSKTDVGVFSQECGPHVPLIQAQVRSADYPSLQALVTEFLRGTQVTVDRACFDVAGPVINGRVKITNLPWMMDEASLARDLDVKAVHLVNDLEAVAMAIPILRPNDLATLNHGQPVPNGTIGVVAPGTGLGESFLTWDGSRYIAHGSEGGHADFAPTDERQIGLLRYMLDRFDHVGIERVCSGIGIPNIYDYLRDVEAMPETSEVAEMIASAKDRTAAIVDAAINPDRSSQRCTAAVDMFASILAAEAGNTALKFFATGGIYLAGGIPARILSVLQRRGFRNAFTRKGRFTQFMESIPVHVILSRAALLGPAGYGLEKSSEDARA